MALAAHVVPVTGGAALAALEDGALARLHQDPAAGHVRADVLFSLAARILGAPAPPGLGRAWAIGEAARGGEAGLAAPAPPPVPRPLRALLALDRLGTRDAARGHPPEARGTLPRQAIIARTMLFG